MSEGKSETTVPLVTLRDVVACRIAELVNGLGLGKFDPSAVSPTQLRRYYDAADYAISLPALAGVYGVKDRPMTDKTTPACRYCGRTEWPYCMNSRDVEDSAIHGSNRCFAALEQQGWGEAGERYVRLNREKNL